MDRLDRMAAILVCGFLMTAPLSVARADADFPDRNGPAAPAAPGTEYLAVPPAAFVPADDLYDYENYGNYLAHMDASYADGVYYAPVNLPHGAVVKKVDFCFFQDYSNSLSSTNLVRSDLSHQRVEMAVSPPTGVGSNYFITTDSSITDPLINNLASVYWLELHLPPSTHSAGTRAWGCGVTIHYTPPAVNTGILSVPASGFKPEAIGYSWNKASSHLEHVNGDCYGGPVGTGCYVAGLNFPDGAVLTRLTLRYIDTHPSASLSLSLHRANQDYTVHDVLATVQSLNSGAAQGQNFAIPSGGTVVDNLTYSYWLELRHPNESISGDLFAYGAIAQYTLPAFRAASDRTPAAADGPKATEALIEKTTRILSLSTAEFTPLTNRYYFLNNGQWVVHRFSNAAGGTANGFYFAPVYLPQGARVTYILPEFFNRSSFPAAGYASLVRKFGNTFHYLAHGESTYTAGYSYEIIKADDPATHTIDNTQYAYFFIYELPVSTLPVPPGPGDLVGASVKILYTPPTYTFLPLIRK